jgi:hypothetical protein
LVISEERMAGNGKRKLDVVDNNKQEKEEEKEHRRRPLDPSG